MTDLRIERAVSDDVPDWAVLRHQLWPEDGLPAHRAVATEWVSSEHRLALIARVDGRAIGLAEAAIRYDEVNGCDRPPVLFLEGLYVAPGHRRAGIARALVTAAADWGRAHGLSEFGSDAALGNEASHAAHRALGFTETERVVFFRRMLEPGP